ncbi:MAG: YlqD family protein [Candidatus Margulisiibacteriota bacterium]|nr:YlqD family protein [Candidatus Margulisiibacteriota bacterium]
MAEKRLIELKRVVMVKAIVTDAFKQNLQKELERAVANIDAQTSQLDQRSKIYLDNLKKKGLNQRAAAFKHQMTEEKAKQAAAKSDLLMKIEEAKKLQIGSEFVQGPLEGPVMVGIGDNLYKKVGGTEIIVKDGVIQEIRQI